MDTVTAWRTGLLLAVGGEFGFALLAIALDARVIAEQTAQIALTSVLFSMIAAPFLIRYNHTLALRFASSANDTGEGDTTQISVAVGEHFSGHVIICGYGRIGQSLGHLLEEEKIPYVALDLDAPRVREARIAGEPVYYGDSSEHDMLEAVGVASARLVVVSHEDVASAHKVLQQVRTLHPDLPVMVRTRDETHVEELRRAGATEVVPETLEAGMMIASHALLLLNVPLSRVVRRMQALRSSRYRLLHEFFRGNSAFPDDAGLRDSDRLYPVQIPAGSRFIGQTLGSLQLDGVVITALARDGKRIPAPKPETILRAGDALVLFGVLGDLQQAEDVLLG